MKFNRKNQINFTQIAQMALAHAHQLVPEWLPGGKMQGNEYVVRNPKRNDKNIGSFKINMKTGRWADFATNVRGGDLISLHSYLTATKQSEAALSLSKKLGGNHD